MPLLSRSVTALPKMVASVHWPSDQTTRNSLLLGLWRTRGPNAALLVVTGPRETPTYGFVAVMGSPSTTVPFVSTRTARLRMIDPLSQLCGGCVVEELKTMSWCQTAR